MWLKKQMDELRKLGFLGKALAAIVQFIFFANPGLTWAVIVTFVLAKFTAALQWAQEPAVYSSAGIFVFLLWTWIGIVVLRDRPKTRTVRIAHDYAYSLICTGAQLTLGKFQPNHAAHPNDMGFMFVFNFQNVGAGPLRLNVDESRVVINGMTGADPEKQPEIMMARVSQKGLRAIVRREPGKPEYTGTATFKFSYGPPEGEFIRKYTLRLKIGITVDEEKATAFYSDELLEEKDEPFAGLGLGDRA